MALLSWLAAAAPGGGHLDLTWDAPAGCPPASRVQERVRRLVGGAHQRPVKAAARIQHDARGWSLSLQTKTEGQTGERELQAPDCASLADAAALILAWMIDPDLVPDALPAASAPASPGVPSAPSAVPPASTASSLLPAAPPEESSPAAPAEEPPEASPAAGRGSRARWGAFLGAAADGGWAPGAGAGPLLGAEVSGERWGAALAASWVPARRGTAEARPTAAARVEAGALGGRVCGAPWWGLSWARVCGGATALWLRAQGEGVQEPLRGGATALALGGGVQARYPLGEAWWLLLGVEGSAPLVRPAFRIEGVGVVHRTPAVVAGGWLAVGRML